MKVLIKNKQKEIVRIIIILITFLIFYKYIFGYWEEIKQFLFGF